MKRFKGGMASSGTYSSQQSTADGNELLDMTVEEQTDTVFVISFKPLGSPLKNFT